MYEFTQFISHRSEDGYEWRSGPFTSIPPKSENFDEPALVALGERPLPYRPEDHLFVKFAAIDPNADTEILNFANSYGLLGGGPLLRRAPKPGHKGGTIASVRGELRSHWQEHLHRMKAAVTLWQAIHAKDTSVLAKCIRWPSPAHVTYEWPPSSEWITPWSTHATIASREINPHLLDRFRPGDVTMPARIYLQEVVNGSLDEFVAPRLLWTDREKMGLFIVPSTLIGCLWVQLAKAIAESCKFRICEGCGKPMLVAPEGSGYRTNRRTCSNACRIRLYSRRKLEARQLRNQGLSVREIAKRLDTEIERVKRWIAN
jgi:hypothetical protein